MFIVLRNTTKPYDGHWFTLPPGGVFARLYSVSTVNPDIATFVPTDWYERREDGEWAEIGVPEKEKV